ncbi:MAG: hypothetical protein NXY57DRAFT_965872 [Lentinula lateritia]|nr:MAG: hypothetical protein NXY57DRAFT_965872 [Lentinula lateritia]
MLAPSAGPCFGVRPLSHEPLLTPLPPSSPQLSSHSPTLNSLPSLARLADSQLSGHSVSSGPLPFGEESPSSICGSSREADLLLVHNKSNDIQSTPGSTGQAEQVQHPIVNLGVSEKSLAKATSALKTKLLNQAIRLNRRKGRANSAQDAVLYAKSKELNQATINEIRHAAELDRDLQNAKTDPDKFKVLMDELEEHQQAKKDVARASNKAGAMKATKLLQGFNSDVSVLKYSYAQHLLTRFGFFVRGSFESSIKPTIVGGGPVLEFFQKYFNKDPWEMACLFEAFVTTYNKVGSRKLLHSEKAKATSKTISESLAHITGIDKIRMNYPNFRTKISAKYKVKIIGWPIDVPLVSPRDITDPSKLDTLYDAWRSGSAYWSTMDKQEYRRFMQQLDNDKAAGLQIKIPRKG